MTMMLRVRAAHSAMCPDFEALEDGCMRFVGRRFDAAGGHDRAQRRVVRPGLVGGKAAPVVVTEPATNGGAWVPTDEPVEVPLRAEYLHELRAGALLPADAETARLAGVPFSE